MANKQQIKQLTRVNRKVFVSYMKANDRQKRQMRSILSKELNNLRLLLGLMNENL